MILIYSPGRSISRARRQDVKGTTVSGLPGQAAVKVCGSSPHRLTGHVPRCCEACAERSSSSSRWCFGKASRVSGGREICSVNCPASQRGRLSISIAAGEPGAGLPRRSNTSANSGRRSGGRDGSASPMAIWISSDGAYPSGRSSTVPTAGMTNSVTTPAIVCEAIGHTAPCKMRER